MTPEQSMAYGRKKFRELGLNDEQIHGIMGSVMGESGRNLNPKSYNPKDPNGGSRGIFQMHGSRWDGVVALANKTGRSPEDPRVQWDQAAQELLTTERAALDRVRKAKTRQEAARAWTDGFERPSQKYANHASRAANADYVASRYSSNNGTDMISGGDGTDMLMGGDGFGTDSNQGPGHSPDQQGTLPGGIMDLFGGGNADMDPSTPGQNIAMMLGGMVGGTPGIKLASTLFGSHGEPGANLSMPEGISMALGGLVGGLPGAALGQMLGQAIGGLFGVEAQSSSKDRGPDLAPTSSPTPQARPDNLGSGGSGGSSGGGGLLGGIGDAIGSLFK